MIAQEEDVKDQYQDVFVLIANASNDYYELRTEMFKLSNTLNIEIDTMGRGFNKSKNLICLSEDDEDEIYAGDYFPRRSISNKLSLEYLTLYIELDDSEKNTIALVASICEKQDSAIEVLNRVQITNPNAYIIEASIFMGCIH